MNTKSIDTNRIAIMLLSARDKLKESRAEDEKHFLTKSSETTYYVGMVEALEALLDGRRMPVYV